MDLKKMLIISSAACLVVMMVYLTFVKSKKPDAKTAAKPAATAKAEATAEEDEANPDCAEYSKAFVKTSRTIKSSAVWEDKGAPYVVIGNLVIAKSAIFILKPGVVIKFMGKDTSFIVKGKFVSKGTKEKPVILTSIKDDIGGDTNCDGGKSKPANGDYGIVQIKGEKSGNYEVRYAREVK